MFSRHRTDKLVDIFLPCAVHTYETAQRIHVGVHGEVSAEYLVQDACAHLPDNADPHADPASAPLQETGDLRHAHGVNAPELVNQSGLLQHPEASRVCNADELDDPESLITTQRHVRHHAEPELSGAPVTFESVEQNPGVPRVDPLQGLTNAVLHNGSKQRLLRTGVLHAAAFVA